MDGIPNGLSMGRQGLVFDDLNKWVKALKITTENSFLNDEQRDYLISVAQSYHEEHGMINVREVMEKPFIENKELFSGISYMIDDPSKAGSDRVLDPLTLFGAALVVGIVVGVAVALQD